MFDERIRRLLDCIRNIFQTGMDGGLLRPVDTGILSRMFAGLIYGLLALPEPPEREAAAESLRALLETGIFALGRERET